jgi:hypothetical protein
MDSTASWVIEAIDTLSLAGQVRRIDGSERSKILARVTDAFLERSDVTFWGSNLKVPQRQWHTEHGYTYLPQLAPDPQSACWLITGLTDANDDMGVFECTPATASALIGECPGFEYAVVDPALEWMVIEDHHDVLIAAGDAIARLSRLSG